MSDLTRSVRLKHLYFHIKRLPLDLRRIIVDYAASEIWRANIEENIIFKETESIVLDGPFSKECSSIVDTCVPYVVCSHKRLIWLKLFRQLVEDVVVNQYTGGPRSCNYVRTQISLASALKTITSLSIETIYEISCLQEK